MQSIEANTIPIEKTSNRRLINIHMHRNGKTDACFPFNSRTAINPQRIKATSIGTNITVADLAAYTSQCPITGNSDFSMQELAIIALSSEVIAIQVPSHRVVTQPKQITHFATMPTRAKRFFRVIHFNHSLCYYSEQS